MNVLVENKEAIDSSAVKCEESEQDISPNTEDLVQDDGLESDVALDENPVDGGNIEKDDLNPNTEDPVQNDESESNVERRQPVRAYPRRTSRRKRTPTYQEADISKERKKARSNKDGRADSRQIYSFNDRCKQLLRFKEEFGHCNIPFNQELGVWCTNLRCAYHRIKKGLKTDRNLPQDRIDRLEKMGFQWKGIDHDVEFEKRCRELVAFKEEFGHCNVTKNYVAKPSLGTWCSHARTAYNNVQKGKKSDYNLSKERIDRLEEIGFQWKAIDYDEGFEKRLFELKTFKEEFGHCNVPQRYVENTSLGEWCTTIRGAYKKIQNGLTPGCNLSQERIHKLEEIGFQWNGLEFRHDKIFQKNCRDLLTFKEEFGHCNVPEKYKANKSLGPWCSTVRRAHTKMEKGKKSDYNLSKERIDRLEEIGFQWEGRRLRRGI